MRQIEFLIAVPLVPESPESLVTRAKQCISYAFDS